MTRHHPLVVCVCLRWSREETEFPDWDKVWQMGGWKLGSLATAAAEKDVRRCRLVGRRSNTNPLVKHLFCQNIQNYFLVTCFDCCHFFHLPCTVLSFPVNHLTVKKKKTKKTKEKNTFAYLDLSPPRSFLSKSNNVSVMITKQTTNISVAVKVFGQTVRLWPLNLSEKWSSEHTQARTQTHAPPHIRS